MNTDFIRSPVIPNVKQRVREVSLVDRCRSSHGE